MIGENVSEYYCTRTDTKNTADEYNFKISVE
jgi:hypothetical protein